MRTGSLEEKELFQRVQWVVEYGFVVQTSHFRQELKEAQADMLDVRHLLLDERTRLVEANYDRKRNFWKYRIEGWDLGDRSLTVVLCLDLRNSKLILITVW